MGATGAIRTWSWGGVLWIAAVAASAPAAAQSPVSGYVVGVHDGDTLTVLRADKTQIKVRLADIDAPELGQAFGTAAKRALAAACMQRVASIIPTAVDRHGRMVGRIDCGAGDASTLMVRQGLAWAYREYLTRVSLLGMEGDAKAARIGLWAQAAVPPWEWRRERRGGAADGPRDEPPRPSPSEAAPLAAGVVRDDPQQQLVRGESRSLAGLFEGDQHKSLQQLAEERGARFDAGGGGLGPGSMGGGSRGSPGPVLTGPRGGRYYQSDSGGKVYVPRHR